MEIKHLKKQKRILEKELENMNMKTFVQDLINFAEERAYDPQYAYSIETALKEAFNKNISEEYKKYIEYLYDEINKIEKEINKTSKLEKVKHLCRQRRLNKFMPKEHEWNGAKEQELISLIKELEEEKIKFWKDWDSILIACNYDAKFKIYPNSNKFGCEQITSAPIAVGNTPIQALKNAWRMWSIPPCLICNADYFIKEIKIRDVL